MTLLTRHMSVSDRRSGAGAACGRRLLRLLRAGLIALAAPSAEAAVERVEILEQSAFAGGAEFGAVGSYERIGGRLHFAVDPEHPANAEIVVL